MFLGIDLGGTTCAFGLVGDDGHIGQSREIETRQTDAPAVLLGRVAQAARELIQQSLTPVRAVGIGVPGHVRHAEGICVYAPNLSGWHNLPVGPLLAEQIGVPVHALNDANAAALGEARFGAGRGSDDLLVLTLGTGIGSGLILDGQLRLGASERGAEVGHITVDVKDKRGSGGNVGTLESVCGRDAIVWRAMRAMTWGHETLIAEICPDLSQLAPLHIAQAASRATIWRAASGWRPRAIWRSASSTSSSPPTFRASSSPEASPRVGEPLFAPLRHAVAARTSRFTFDVSQIVPAALGNDAGTIGAAQWARERSAS